MERGFRTLHCADTSRPSGYGAWLMIDRMRVLGLVPARGASKRLPRKNILPLAGRPLIGWTFDAAAASHHLDRVVLSTDDRETFEVARRLGADVPFLRPAEFARDASSSVDVALHALGALGESYDLLVLLQPTSPLRTAADIDDTIRACVAAGLGRSFTVSEACKSPYKMYRLDAAGHAVPLLTLPASFRDQDLPTTYASNGAVYAVDVARLGLDRTFVAEPMPVHVMPKDRSVDIDDEVDFLLAEALLARRGGRSGAERHDA